MYLKKIFSSSGVRYVIRESYWDGEAWTYRDLVELGSDPRKFIHYVGNGFYFDEALEDRLEKLGVSFNSQALEELFFPFLDPYVKRIISNFSHFRNRSSSYSDREMLEKQRFLHDFDKRRMHFLRCGRIDIGYLGDKAWKFLNVLIDKSRDEIETIIERMERQLRPREVKSYIYTAFNLQEYFRDSIVKHHPYALDQEKVDEAFLDSLCRLNRDKRFFMGVKDHDGSFLHPYLRKYLVLYFDSSFESAFSWHDFIRSIFGAKERNGYRRWLSSSKGLSLEEACKRLGIDFQHLETLSLKEIKKIYRQEARKLHPDAGGSHEDFIKLSEAYKTIVEMRFKKA